MSEVKFVGFPYVPEGGPLEGSGSLQYAMQQYDGDLFFEDVKGASCTSCCWCSERRQQMSIFKANYYLWLWGLAYSRPDGNLISDAKKHYQVSEIKLTDNPEYRKQGNYIDWDCTWIGCGCGCSGTWTYEKVDYATAAEYLNCADIGGALDIAWGFESQYGRWAGASSSLAALSRRHAMNQDVWFQIANYLEQVKSYKDSRDPVNCYVEDAVTPWEAYNKKLEDTLAAIPEPMSNGTLALVVVGGALSLTIILTKFIK
jgi:hypothetical protein